MYLLAQPHLDLLWSCGQTLENWPSSALRCSALLPLTELVLVDLSQPQAAGEN